MHRNRIGMILPLFFFLLGAGSTITQSILFREFTVIFYGNELVLGYLLFSWLLSIALGALVYSLISGRIREPHRVFCISALTVAAAPLVLIPVIRISRQFTGVDYGLLIPFHKMALLSLGLLLLPGMASGFTFPLGCRIRNGVGEFPLLYAMEAAGSLGGGLLFSFLLVRILPVFHCGVIIFASMALGVMWARLHRWTKGIPDALSMGLVLSVFVLVAMAPGVEEASRNARWKTLVKGIPLLAQADSPYQNLAIGEQEGQYPVYFNGVFGYAFPDPYGDAAKAHHILTQSPAPRQVLVLGQVTPGFIGEVLKHPVEKMTVIHMDPALDKLIDPYMTPEEKKIIQDPRVTVLHGDPRLFLVESPGPWDMVFVAMPDPTSALTNRYYTLEFFRHVRRVLAPGGVLALSVASSEYYLSETLLEYNRTIFKTLREVFPVLITSPGHPAFIFASTDPASPTEDPQVLFHRFQAREIKETTFTPYLFETFYEGDRLRFFQESLGDLREAKFNRDLEPVAYLQGLKLWDGSSDSRLSPIINKLEKGGFAFIYWVIAVFVLGLSVAVMALPVKRTPLSPPGMVFASGFCGMGVSLLLLYSYQNLYGYLYERIGFVVGLYMLGIFAGGLGAGHIIKRKSHPWWMVAIPALFLGILCLGISPLIDLLGGKGRGWVVLLYGAMITAGILSGLVAPLCVELISRMHRGTESSSPAVSLVWGADHLGGCLGALVLGAFLVPLMGTGPVSYLLGAFMGASLIPLLAEGYRFTS